MLFRKEPGARGYDPARIRPVIRVSICTGEKTAGFRELQTGRFIEVMLLRTPRDLEEFRRLYRIPEGPIPTEY